MEGNDIEENRVLNIGFELDRIAQEMFEEQVRVATQSRHTRVDSIQAARAPINVSGTYGIYGTYSSTGRRISRRPWDELLDDMMKETLKKPRKEIKKEKKREQIRKVLEPHSEFKKDLI